MQMVSSVTNSILPRATVLDETYLSANLLRPVIFNQAIQTIQSSEEFAHVNTLIEVSPHPALAGPIRQIKGEFKFERLEYLSTLKRNEHSAASILKLAGVLFVRNYPIDLELVTTMQETSPSGRIWHTKGSLIVDLLPYQ